MTNNYDVIIVGGGVVGTAVLMQLSRYNLKTLLIEKEDDVSCGASRANSGIVHAGYDCVPHTQKAYFNVLGNRMFADHCRELDVPYRNTGSLVVCYGDGLDGLQVLLEKGKANGCVVAPPSKSVAHRMLICGALSAAECHHQTADKSRHRHPQLAGCELSPPINPHDGTPLFQGR